MFLNGADGKTPEIRPSAIKASLRFWWRAANGHLSKENLKKEEEKLFGGTGTQTLRSSLIIRMPYIQPPLQTKEFVLVPHKQNMRAKAIQPGQQFQVILMYREEPSEGYFKSLLILSSVLGGMGKRSRRGMGSWKITRIDGEKFDAPSTLTEIHRYLSAITKYYRCDERGIFFTYSGPAEKYPWISAIELSKKLSDKPLDAVSLRTHDMKKKYGQRYEGSMGHAFKGRFASPIYVSMIKPEQKLRPIVTTLNAIPDKRELAVDLSVQRDFKEGIL